MAIASRLCRKLSVGQETAFNAAHNYVQGWRGRFRGGFSLRLWRRKCLERTEGFILKELRDRARWCRQLADGAETHNLRSSLSISVGPDADRRAKPFESDSRWLGHSLLDAYSQVKASASWLFQGFRVASAPAAYPSRMVLQPSMQASLLAGWLAFIGRELNPLDRDEGFQITFVPSLDFSWRNIRKPSHKQTFSGSVGRSQHWQQFGSPHILRLRSRPVRGRSHPGERDNACQSNQSDYP